MRVLEASLASQPIMGKKKHKLRKQNRENELCPGSDSSDEAVVQGMPGRSCPHLNKAINFATLRKAIRQLGGIGECTTCQRDGSSQRHDPGERAGRSSPTEGDQAAEDAETTVWVCLQCGHLGCDRNSKDKHALKHYQTPRSASHSMAVNVTMWVAWCYDCDDEVGIETSRRLTECVDFLRKQSEGAPGPSHTLSRKSSISRADTSSPTIEAVGEASSAAKDDKANLLRKARPQTPLPSLPKVKGLSNLGNTCFFNAVMQNLSQTPLVEHVLSERSQKGVSVRLPGRPCYESDSEDSSLSDEEKEDDMELEPIQLQMPECGPLTQSVLTFIRDMHSATKNSTISPSSLFGQVCRKAPRFKGFQQQDSHELLRHLLDGMKAEEIRRAQQGILKAFQLPGNVSKKKVDEDMRIKLKAYGRQAKHTFVDSLFGGYFLSTVQCEECHTPSQIFEPFQDISLPITEEKPSRPNSLWGGRKKENKPDLLADMGIDDSTAGVDGRGSKHMSKKAKKQAKRDAKRKMKASKNQVGPTEGADESNDEEAGEAGESAPTVPTITTGEAKSTSKPEESQSNDEWDSKSDADVEDNLESDVSRSRLSLPQDALLRTSVGSHALVGGDEYHADKRSSSDMSVEGMLPVTDLAVTHSSGSTTPKASTSDMQSLSSGLSTLTLEKSESGDSRLAFIDDDVDVSQSESRDVYDADVSAVDCTPCRDKTDFPSASVKRPNRTETQLHALSSLAPRYHSASHECSVMSCLNQFTAAELLTGNNKFGCRRCTKRKHGNQTGADKKEMVYTNASKQVLVFSPPAVLTLHLKRFQQVGFSLRKVNRHVEFPLVLDLAPYCSALSQGVKAGQSKVLYSLYGVVEHSGRLTGGHYTAYVKVRPNSNKLNDFLQRSDLHSNQLRQVLCDIEQSLQGEAEGPSGEDPEVASAGKWYYISDSRVSEVNEANVLRCQAYLLFYERFH